MESSCAICTEIVRETWSKPGEENGKDSARERNGITLADCAVTKHFSQPYQEAQAMPKDSHAYPDHWSTTFFYILTE